MDIKDILTLSDGNQYEVVGKTAYEYKIYLYLQDINNNNIKFCYLDNDEVVVIDDNDLIVKLLSLLLENKNNLKKWYLISYIKEIRL